MTISAESKPSVDDIVAALLRDAGTIDLRGREARLFVQSVRTLAQGKPLAAQDVAEIASGVGLSKHQADDVLNWLAERNEEGDIVGLAGLSLNQWNHDFEINGRHFSTWCALDNLYLPQIIGKDAKIQSKDPVTEEKIHVTLAPDGVVKAPAGVEPLFLSVDEGFELASKWFAQIIQVAHAL